MPSMKQTQKLQKAQNVCFRVMKPNLSVTESAKSLCILKAHELVDLELSKLSYKLTHDILPVKLAEHMTRGESLKKSHKYSTRNKNIPNLPLLRLNVYQKASYPNLSACT